MDIPRFPCTLRQALQNVQELVARYGQSDDAQLVRFLNQSQTFIKYCASDVQATLSNDADLDHPREPDNIKETPKQKISVDITGAYPSDTIMNERQPVLWTDLQFFEGARIHSLQVNLSDGRAFFGVPNSSEIIQTLRLALHKGCDNLYIDVPSDHQEWHVDFMNSVFQNSPSFISAKSILVHAYTNNHPEVLQVCTPLKDFLIRAVTQPRNERLTFTYFGANNDEMGDAVAAGFSQEIIEKCDYNATMSEAQLKTILDRDDCVPEYDRATIKTRIDFEERFPDFVKENFGVEEEVVHLYFRWHVHDGRTKIVKPGYQIDIRRSKCKVTVTVVRKDKEETEDNSSEDDKPENKDEPADKDEPGNGSHEASSKKTKQTFCKKLLKRFK